MASEPGELRGRLLEVGLAPQEVGEALVGVKAAIEAYLRRPRPSMREAHIGPYQVLPVLVLGPASLIGSLYGVLVGQLWPGAIILPLSLCVTAWMIAWLRRPTRVSRTTRRDGK